MALSPSKAVDAARQILTDQMGRERRRLDRIARALNPRMTRGATRQEEQAYWDGEIAPSVELPTGATPTMMNLARKARTNYLPRILNEFVQALVVDGYRAAGGTDNARPWTHWQANRLDGRQGGVHRDTLAYGIAYTTVLPGDTGPVIRGVSPRKLTAVYGDPVEDDWPILALRHDDPLMRLYDEEQVYFIGRQSMSPTSVGRVEFIDAQAHELGVCPVVRFREEMLLDEFDQTGIVEPLLALQRRLDETVFGLLIAQFYAAFQQRYVIGWVPKDEEEKLRASASALWTFADDPSQVSVGSLPETDLTRYIEAKGAGVTDMATIAQVPHQNLGIGAIANLSAEALAAMEHGKNNRAGQFRTSIGESWEQTLRLAATAAGDSGSAEDVSSQVRWKDTTARSFAAMVDGLGKMVQMLGVPARATWPLIPDVTDLDLTAWERLAADADVLAQIRQLIADAVTAGKAPSTAELVALVSQGGATTTEPVTQ